MWLLLACECRHGSKCVCFSSFNNINSTIGPFTRSGTCSPPIRCPPWCCQCCRAARIGRCLQVYADSVYWHRKELHLNTCLCMDTGFFFWLTKAGAYESQINNTDTLTVRISETCSVPCRLWKMAQPPEVMKPHQADREADAFKGFSLITLMSLISAILLDILVASFVDVFIFVCKSGSRSFCP